MNLVNSDEMIDGDLISSDDEAEGYVFLSDNEEEQEADGPKAKKKRTYTQAQLQRKTNLRRTKNAIKKAYVKGVKDTQRIEEKEMLEKIDKGEYMYFGDRKSVV